MSMRIAPCSMQMVTPAKRTLCFITASGFLRRQPTAQVQATNLPAVLFTGTRVGHNAGCIPCDGMPEPAASHHPRQARCSGIGPIGNACRSEERRVGKEGGSRWSRYSVKEREEGEKA